MPLIQNRHNIQGNKVKIDKTTESLRVKATNLLQAGDERYQTAADGRELDAKGYEMTDALTWHVALVVDPDLPGRLADADSVPENQASNPRYSSRPVWPDNRDFTTEQCWHTKQIGENEGWEALIVASMDRAPYLDYMYVGPSGQCYCRHALLDDLTDEVRPGDTLDPILVIRDVAEATAVGISMVQNLAHTKTEEPRQIGFAFRWTKLADRVLTPWAIPGLRWVGEPRCHENEVTTFIQLPSDTPIPSIAPFVEEATRELFALFDGERIAPKVFEDWTSKQLERRL